MTDSLLIRVGIVDDHQLFREGVKLVLNETSTLACVCEYADLSSYLNDISLHEIDVLLLDISLPDSHGIESIDRIKNVCSGVFILVLSMHDEEQFGIRAMRAGAHGYLHKNNTASELVMAVTLVSKGVKYISRSLSCFIAINTFGKIALPVHHYLSPREFDVMLLLAKGVTPTEISKKLFISIKTVSTYRSHILKKLSIKTNTDMTRYCLEHQLIL